MHILMLITRYLNHECCKILAPVSVMYWYLDMGVNYGCIFHVHCAGIYKEAYLKEIFKKYGDEEDAPTPPELPDWCYEASRNSTYPMQQSGSGSGYCYK